MKYKIKNTWVNNSNRGVSTLETAMILPIVISVILLLIFFLIHLYDRNVMQIAASQGAMQVLYLQNVSNEKIKEECEKKAEQVLKEQLVYMTDCKVSVTVTKLKVSVEIKGESQMQKMNLFGLELEPLLPLARAYSETPRLSQGRMIYKFNMMESLYDFAKNYFDEGEGKKDDSDGIQKRDGL